MKWKVERRFKRRGTCVYIWLIHVDIWQKPTQHCKVIILQLEIIFLSKNKTKKAPMALRLYGKSFGESKLVKSKNKDHTWLLIAN